MIPRFFILPCLLGLLGGSVLGGYVAWRSGGEAGYRGSTVEGAGGSSPSVRQVRAPRMKIKKMEGALSGDSLEYFRAIPLSRFPAEVARLVKEDKKKDLQTLFEVWASRDPGDARSSWEALPFSKRKGTSAALFRGWMVSNADEALSYLSENRKSRGELHAACRAVLPILVEDYPEKALPWLRSFGGSVRQSQMNIYFDLCLSRSVEDAVQFQSRLDERERNLLCSSEEIALRWGETDWDGALKWINSQPADKRHALHLEAIAGLGLTDPDRMKKELATLPEGEERDKFLCYLASSRWSGNDVRPRLNLEDILKMQTLFQKQEHAWMVISQVAGSLAEAEPDRLLTLVKSSAAGEERDIMIAKYAERNDRLPLQERLDMLENLNGSGEQRRAASRLLIDWNDPQKAEEWVEKSSASPELKQQWKKAIRNTPPLPERTDFF